MNRLPRLLAFSCLLATVAALWLRFQPLSSPDTSFGIELLVSSPASGEAWLRFNVGDGWNIHDTRALWITQSSTPRRYRVALPAGDFKSFRLLPPETAKSMALVAARIVDADGTVAAQAPGARYVPELNTIPFSFAKPLRISAPGERSWAESVLDFILLAAVVALVSAGFSRKFAALAARATRAAAWFQAHPRVALLGAALLAVAMSCHPVIFFGRSFVSPNNGTLCLYDVQPTLPGAPADRVEEWTRSDVNATPWAHLPYSMITHDAVLRDRELPLWNRFTMCGLTLLGQGQSMPGDPLFWVPVVANGAAWAWDIHFLAAKTIFAFGIGLLVFAVTRRIGVAAMLTFSSAFIGFFSYRFNHPAIFSLSYAPWVLLCWLNVAAAPGWRRAAPWALAAIAANWLVLNSGTAKEAGMLLLTMNAAGALAIFLSDEPRRLRLQKLALLSVSGVLFLAVSAPIWMVFLDALKKAVTIYDVPATHQIAPGLLIGLFDDLFYRQLVLDEWHVNPALNFLALAGVLWAIADWRRVRVTPHVRALAFAALPPLALVFGAIPPAVIDRLPLLRNVSHVDNTFTCVLIVLLFPLAGAGLGQCLDRARAGREWFAVWKRALTLLLLLAGMYSGTVFATPRLDEFALRLVRPTVFSHFFICYATVLVAGAAALPWLARRASLKGGAANWLALVLCLVVFHFRHGMWLETKFDYYVMNPQPRVQLQAHSPAVESIRSRLAEPGRVIGFGQVLQPGFNAVLGLESVAGADAVGSQALAEWDEAAGLGARWLWSPALDKDALAASRPFLDAMNVRYYLRSPANRGEPAPGLRRIAAADLDVFESESAWPRAFFTDRVSRYQDVRTLAQWIGSGDGRPFAAVSIDDAPVPELSANLASRRVAGARDYRLTSNGTSFTIDAPSAGLAVLNESFVAGDFRARIDGRATPVIRVNHIFKGVLIPAAGTHRVTIEYWPHVLTPALACAGCALVAIAASALFLWRPRERRPACAAAPANSGSPASAAPAHAAAP